MTRQYISVQVHMTRDKGTIPQALRLPDGKLHKIERIIEIQPSFSCRGKYLIDRYTVIFDGKESYIFLEHDPEYMNQLFGRWYIEQSDSSTKYF